jgi:DNA polymerase sigma
LDPRLKQMLGGKPSVIEARRLPLLQFYAVLPNEPPVQVELSIAGTQHSGLPAVPLVRQLCVGIPGLREIVLFVKRMLYMHHLNRPREGGLSSYGLLLMVAAFLKERPAHNGLGEALVELCAFYGCIPTALRDVRVLMAPSCSQNFLTGKGESKDHNKLRALFPFNYASVAITVSDKAKSPSFALRTGTEPLYIRDPLQMSANVAACTWRVQEVQAMFQNAYAYFTGARSSCAASADDSDEPILPARQSPPDMKDEDSRQPQARVQAGKLVNKKKSKPKKGAKGGREKKEGEVPARPAAGIFDEPSARHKVGASRA